MNWIRKLSWKDAVSVIVVVVFILFVQSFLSLQWRLEAIWKFEIIRTMSYSDFYYLNMGFYLLAGLGLGLFVAWNNYYLSWFRTWIEFIILTLYAGYLMLAHPVFQFTPWNFGSFDTSHIGSALLGLGLVLLPVRISKLRVARKKQ